jgi:hypothetical protein
MSVFQALADEVILCRGSDSQLLTGAVVRVRVYTRGMDLKVWRKPTCETSSRWQDNIEINLTEHEDVQVYSNDSGWASVPDCFEHGNEPLNHIKRMEIFD